MTTDTLTLVAYHCANGVGYRVTFEGPRVERRALRWMNRKAATHAFALDEEYPVPRWCIRLWDRLFPLCHHGLSLDLCADPINHYPRDDDYGYW